MSEVNIVIHLFIFSTCDGWRETKCPVSAVLSTKSDRSDDLTEVGEVGTSNKGYKQDLYPQNRHISKALWRSIFHMFLLFSYQPSTSVYSIQGIEYICPQAGGRKHSWIWEKDNAWVVGCWQICLGNVVTLKLELENLIKERTHSLFNYWRDSCFGNLEMNVTSPHNPLQKSQQPF